MAKLAAVQLTAFSALKASRVEWTLKAVKLRDEKFTETPSAIGLEVKHKLKDI